MNVEQTKAKILDTLSAEKQKLPLSVPFWKVRHFDPNEKADKFHLVSKTQMTECYEPTNFYKPITVLFDLPSHEQNSI